MRKANIRILLLAAIVGFLGGLAGNVVRTGGAEAQPTTLRAERFELVDASGAPVAFWGPDEGQKIVLAFIEHNGNQLAALGVESGPTAFMDFKGRDGKTRFAVQLRNPLEKPSLVLSDNTYEGRVMFGFIPFDAPSPEDDDWALVFRPPHSEVGIASLGVLKDHVKQDRYATIRLLGRNGKVWSAP